VKEAGEGGEGALGFGLLALGFGRS
jgi:hypothetical protein